MATVYDTADIFLESPVRDVSILPAELKGTHRILLKFLNFRYETDQDLTLKIYIKKKKDDTEEVLEYTLSKDETFFKKKLRRFLLCREFRSTLEGEGLTSLILYSAEVLWIPVPIGMGGRA
jgi:hypothetical protein